MRVTTWIEIAQNVEVDVSVAEVMSTISSMAEDDRLFMTIDCIRNIHDALKAIPDKMIGQLNEHQRKVISEGLHTQAARFETKAANQEPPK